MDKSPSHIQAFADLVAAEDRPASHGLPDGLAVEVDQAEILRAISAAHSRLITGLDPRELFDSLLADLLRLTGSEYGFIAEVLFEVDGTPYLETRDVTETAWNDETRQRFRSLTRLFNRVLVSRAPVISNDPSRDLSSARSFSGRPGLQSFLGVPLVLGTSLVGVAVLVNRSGGYGEELVSVLDPFLTTCANLIEMHRAERRHRESEEALLHSEGRIRGIVDSATSPIVTIDESRVIVHVNAAVERVFGYAAAELVGAPVSVLGAGLEPAALAPAADEGAPAPGGRRDVFVQRKDGTRLPMEVLFSAFRIAGRPMFAGIFHDLSERRHVERLKSEFVATVSHELRTPLTSIRGALGLLAGGVAGPLPAKAMTMIEIALRNSERLGRLINDILDIEKIESGRLDFRIRPVAVDDLVHRSIEANQPFAQSHQVKLQLVGEVPSASVMADDDRFAQVLTNLISNAAKFSPAGESVDVAVARHGALVRVSVRDYGPGIPDEFKTRMFQRFAQADSSDARAKGGTGLGLSIAKAIVERMGGRIGFEPAPARGTTFFFELPSHTTGAL